MDVAKLAAYLIASGDDLDALWGVGKATGPRLPLVLVPTTAGTGSEATPVTVITGRQARKRGASAARSWCRTGRCWMRRSRSASLGT
jgi:alcohol dehydrogenase